jgi:parallel beta-helix repeat protein
MRKKSSQQINSFFVKVVFLLMLTGFPATATTFYLSSKGIDNNSGTSPSLPWGSLKKLAASMNQLRPGDSILLERGSIFYGELVIQTKGLAGKAVYVGAYGKGADPVIKGSLPITKWVHFRENIWRGECPECESEPPNLFLNNASQPLGRHPNEGYATSSRGDSLSMVDNSTNHPDGFWDEAEVVVKSSRWTLDNLPVIKFSHQTFYFSVPSSYKIPNETGYFIQKHLATLDAHGEWYFDKKNKSIYIYLNASEHPNKKKIDASTNDVGLSISNSNHLIIRNLSFFGHHNAIRIINSHDVSLGNLSISDTGINGMEITGCTRPNVEQCTILNTNNNGVVWHNNDGGIFRRNIIRRTGVQAGRGISGNGTYNALSITSDNPAVGKNLIQFNTIDSTGYLGIDFRTSHTRILNNEIRNFCLVKDDGAGIYTWRNAHGDNLIEGNIVFNKKQDGPKTPDHVFASGIYIDDGSANILVRGNTVAHCALAGIFLHNAEKITVTENTLFDNGFHSPNTERGQLLIKFDAIIPKNDRNPGLIISKNKFIFARDATYGLFVSSDKASDFNKLGKLWENIYVGNETTRAIAQLCHQKDQCSSVSAFRLEDWSLAKDQEKKSIFRKIAPRSSDTVNKNLIQNGSLKNETDGWMTWPEQASLKLDSDTQRMLEVAPASGNEVLLYHAGFMLRQGTLYRLSFRARSNAKSNIEFVPLMADHPWAAVGSYTCFDVDNSLRTYSYFFIPLKDCLNSRVNFKSTTKFWIGEVTVHEIKSAKNTEGILQIIYNTSGSPDIVLPKGAFTDLDGNFLTGKVNLAPYHSMILVGTR